LHLGKFRGKVVVVLWTGGYNPVIQVPIGRKENREMKIFRNMVLVVVICSDVMVPPTPLNGHVVGVDDRGVLIAFDMELMVARRFW